MGSGCVWRILLWGSMIVHLAGHRQPQIKNEWPARFLNQQKNLLTTLLKIVSEIGHFRLGFCVFPNHQPCRKLLSRSHQHKIQKA